MSDKIPKSLPYNTPSKIDEMPIIESSRSLIFSNEYTPLSSVFELYSLISSARDTCKITKWSERDKLSEPFTIVPIMDQESLSDAEMFSKLLKIKIEIKAKVEIIINLLSFRI